MRNEALTGYLLHQRPYQEKRALYYLFSEQHGVIHGIGKKGAPLFEPLQLFATGKRELKTFSQINISPNVSVQNALSQNDTINDERPDQQIKRYQQISGQHQYAALYLNEILWKLLPTEDPMPILWQHYQNALWQLKQPLSGHELRLCLRQFERYLFQELGFELTLAKDSESEVIEMDTYYRFLPDVGFMATVATGHSTIDTLQTTFKGDDLIQMAHTGMVEATLDNWSRLHRSLIDHLLEYQPLQSRLLWQQQQRYQ